MEAKSPQKPQRSQASTDFQQNMENCVPQTNNQIELVDGELATSKEIKQRPAKFNSQGAPKIAIHEAKSGDVNKTIPDNYKKVEKSHRRLSSCSDEETKSQEKDFHLSIKADKRDSDDESSLVRSDCLHQDDLAHLAQEIKDEEQKTPSIQDFVPKTVDEADQMGALDDFLLDNQGEDYVPPTMEVLQRKETTEINRQVTGGSIMSQESAKLIRTKGSVNDQSKNTSGIQDYNKLKNERERAQQLFRECLDMQLLGKDFRTEESAEIPEEEQGNIMLLRATRTEGSANLVEVVSHLKHAELNNERGSNSPKISTFKKKAQKKQSRQDLLHVMYKIPKNLIPQKQTVPVLTSKSRKHSRMGKTLERKAPATNLNPMNSRNERTNLSASLNPKNTAHKHNKSFNMYEIQPKKSSSRVPQKSMQPPLLCKTPDIQFVAKVDPPKSNDTPPKNFIKSNINAVILTPASIVKSKKKDSPQPKETQSSNRVNMFLDFDLDKKKNQWKEVYEVPSSKTAKIYSKRGHGQKLLNQSHLVSEMNMTNSISPRVSTNDQQLPVTLKQSSSPGKGKKTAKTTGKQKSSMNKTLQSLKPKSKKSMFLGFENKAKIKIKLKRKEEKKEIDSSDSDDLQRAATNSLIPDSNLLEKQATQQSSFYQVQRSVSYLGSSSSDGNKSGSSTPAGTKQKKKHTGTSRFLKYQEYQVSIKGKK